MELWHSLLEQTVLFLPKMISAAVLFLIGLYLSNWAARAARVATQTRSDDPELILLVERVVRIGCISLAAVIGLGQVDFDLTGFVTGLGIMGVTIGFALQDVAKNFVAGLLLLLQQPFDVGDAIEVSGQAGVVTAIHFRATALRTFDGLEVMIPNADVYVKVVRKFSHDLHRRQSLTITAATGDVDSLLAQVSIALNDVPGIVEDHPNPRFVVDTWEEARTSVTAWFWICLDETTELHALNEAIRAVRTRLGAIALEPKKIEIGPLHPDAAGGVARQD